MKIAKKKNTTAIITIENILCLEEEEIQYHPRSNLNDENHSIRQTIAGVRESASFEEEEVDPEFSPADASTVNESADDAPSAEDTVPEGGDE